MDSKDKTRKMFASLRKQGFLARQNYMCCGGCAGTVIYDDLKDGQRYVTYHQQNNDAFHERDLTRGLYVAFGAKDGTDEETTQAGAQVALAAMRVGLRVEWDGTGSTRICLHDPEVTARLKAQREVRRQGREDYRERVAAERYEEAEQQVAALKAELEALKAHAAPPKAILNSACNILN